MIKLVYEALKYCKGGEKVRYISHSKDPQEGYNMIYCNNQSQKKKVYQMSLEDVKAFKKCSNDNCRQKILNRNGPEVDMLEDC